MIVPAEMSQGWRSSSQKPSTAALAVKQQSSAAEPYLRMSEMSGAIRATNLRLVSSVHRARRQANPVESTQSPRSVLSETRMRIPLRKLPLPSSA